MDVLRVIFLLGFLFNITECQEAAGEEPEPELHPLDGWFNNLIHPDWGAIDTPLLRKSPTAYADGVYHMAGPLRPNPFEISNVAHRGVMGLGSQRGRNAMMTYFGQQVVEEIMDVQRPGCPREFENIDVPRGHDLYDPPPNPKGNVQLPFLRSRYDQRTGVSPSNPRQQINEITPFLDGQLMYGPARAWTDAIREFKGGRLLALNNKHTPIEESFPARNDIRLPFANPPNPRLQGGSERLQPIARFWRLGNPRGFENPFLLSFGVMWFRWHNYLAAKYIKEHNIPDSQLEAEDERIFTEARKRVVASHQKIVMYDWLSRWLKITKDSNGNIRTEFYPINGTKPTNGSDQFNIPDPDIANVPTCPYRGYKPNVHPGITHEFQTSAMRFGHTLVTPGLWRRGVPDASQAQNSQAFCNWTRTNLAKIPNESGETHGFRLCNSYWNSQEGVRREEDPDDVIQGDIDSIFRGMASTLAEQEDHIMVEDLAGQVFGPLEFSRRDLAAINIQRGRDHGLPDYNSVREAFGLPRVKTWEEINPYVNQTQNIDQVIRDLRALYIRTNAALYNFTDPRGVDLFTGGLMETTFDGPGPLFRAIFVDQFCRLRDGDRFWYENEANGLFTFEEIADINENYTLNYIIERTTNVRPSEIPSDSFIHRGASDPCPQPFQLSTNRTVTVNGVTARLIEECTGWQTYDYFFNSEVSFPLTFVFLGLCIPLTVVIMWIMAKQRVKRMARSKKQAVKKSKDSDPNTFFVLEWIGPNTGDRNVKVSFDNQRRKIHVSDKRGKPLRMIDLRSHGEHIVHSITLWIEEDHSQKTVSIRAEGEIDLVLKFADMSDRDQFIASLNTFLGSFQIELRRINMKLDIMMNNATTKEKRQKLLDKFFRIVSLQAFKGTKSVDFQLEQPMDQETAKQIATIQLTRTEFAEAFGLKPTSIFVRNMFMLVDTDKSGFVNFREFLDFFVVLSSEDAESKAQLIFNMYDIRQRGVLSKENFSKMIMSLLDLSDSSLEHGKVADLISAMYRHANIREGSDMTFDDFKKIFAAEEYAKTLEKATLNLDVGMTDPQGQQGKGGKSSRGATLKAKRNTMMRSYQKEEKKRQEKENKEKSGGGKGKTLKRQTSVKVSTKKLDYPQTKFGQWWFEFTSFVATYQLLIFWTILYTLVLFGIFIERAVYYSFEREHVGLRRIAGFGVTVTRGAASAMMFTYSALLITMSRNMITFFRETFLHRFFPWDDMHFLHKYIAFLAMLFTLVHAVGHGINLYHISTQASSDLNCIFREYFRATDVLASFHYWTYTTITGITGIILVLILIVMYVFAVPYARRYVFNAFWFTHNMYGLLYLFSILHGSGRLVQAPLFHTYFIGPVVIFVLDKLISLSRKKIDIRVIKAELLPSDVTALTFKRPFNFEYRSGQWVRIAAQDLGKSEYHPFTLTSAPHEEHLSLHIRAVGPWTTNLRALYDPDNLDSGNRLPLLYLDGAYGEGHQDWYRYKVAILVGGGIGVTPFASILKDIVHKSKIEDLRFPCKKVYFLWVTRTQKQFEWMTDIIREVEDVDTNNFVDVHIFITQFQQKFDFRTTMLYICERHFQKVAGKSLFTGLSAITHFGRPKFGDILRSISHEHPNVSNFGVFSCGPPPMTNLLDRECSHLNKTQGAIFKHHFENF